MLAFVDHNFHSPCQAEEAQAARHYLGDDRTVGRWPGAGWDVAAMLQLVWVAVDEVLGKAQMSR